MCFFFIHARLEITTLIRTSKSLKLLLLFMQGFRPFSGKGYHMGGDVKKADDLDDEDAARLAARLAKLKTMTRGWMQSLLKYEKRLPFTP